ncbi:MAG: hypothetical protein KBA66_16725 [Leptospiraceae bacterium]|nr:hypothetical protein [Leptospiraceae bacterium]
MQADNQRYTQNPNPSNVDKETAQSKVIEFLINKLPDFHYSNTSDAEEDISQELIIYLQRIAISENVLFFFKAEYKEGKRKVDFGILWAQSFSDSKAFFVIEAKRLPARDKESEKEYVFGNYGGMERFKRNLHGVGLSQSAIIGYVQKKDFSLWHTEINSWITEAIVSNGLWTLADKLSGSYTKQLAIFTSKNLRIDETVIQLTHLWIKL